MSDNPFRTATQRRAQPTDQFITRKQFVATMNDQMKKMVEANAEVIGDHVAKLTRRIDVLEKALAHAQQEVEAAIGKELDPQPEPEPTLADLEDAATRHKSMMDELRTKSSAKISERMNR